MRTDPVIAPQTSAGKKSLFRQPTAFDPSTNDFPPFGQAAARNGQTNRSGPAARRVSNGSDSHAVEDSLDGLGRGLQSPAKRGMGRGGMGRGGTARSGPAANTNGAQTCSGHRAD